MFYSVVASSLKRRNCCIKHVVILCSKYQCRRVCPPEKLK